MARKFILRLEQEYGFSFDDDDTKLLLELIPLEELLALAVTIAAQQHDNPQSVYPEVDDALTNLRNKGIEI